MSKTYLDGELPARFLIIDKNRVSDEDTGVIAEGILFTTGRVAIHGIWEQGFMSWYENLQTVHQVILTFEETSIEWLDTQPEFLNLDLA